MPTTITRHKIAVPEIGWAALDHPVLYSFQLRTTHNNWNVTCSVPGFSIKSSSREHCVTFLLCKIETKPLTMMSSNYGDRCERVRAPLSSLSVVYGGWDDDEDTGEMLCHLFSTPIPRSKTVANCSSSALCTYLFVLCWSASHWVSQSVSQLPTHRAAEYVELFAVVDVVPE